MNPVSLDAIKLLVDLRSLNDNPEEDKRLASMIDKLIFIMEKDIEQAYTKYSSIIK